MSPISSWESLLPCFCPCSRLVFEGSIAPTAALSTQIQQSTCTRQFRLPLNHKLSAGLKQLVLSCDCQGLLLSLCFA